MTRLLNLSALPGYIAKISQLGSRLKLLSEDHFQFRHFRYNQQYVLSKTITLTVGSKSMFHVVVVLLRYVLCTHTCSVLHSALYLCNICSMAHIHALTTYVHVERIKQNN